MTNFHIYSLFFLIVFSVIVHSAKVSHEIIAEDREIDKSEVRFDLAAFYKEDQNSGLTFGDVTQTVYPGDVLRFMITLTNIGSQPYDVVQIRSYFVHLITDKKNDKDQPRATFLDDKRYRMWEKQIQLVPNVEVSIPVSFVVPERVRGLVGTFNVWTEVVTKDDVGFWRNTVLQKKLVSGVDDLSGGRGILTMFIGLLVLGAILFVPCARFGHYVRSRLNSGSSNSSSGKMAKKRN
jgi:hypothetical protein